MSIIGTLFVVIKFILYYAKKYKAHKSAEKEFEKVNFEFHQLCFTFAALGTSKISFSRT